MQNFNPNIANLFSSMGVDSPINFSDYASIKNGSYGKLVKAYYAEAKADSTPDKNKNVSALAKKAEPDTTGLSQMKKGADSLKDAAAALNTEDLWKTEDGKVNMDKVSDAVSKFADAYNSVVDKTSKVNSKEVAQSAKYMTGLTNTMTNALSKIGVSVGKDGKLSVDKDALKEAGADKVKAMFAGKNTYGSEISNMANDMAKATVMNSSVYSGNATLNSAMTGLFNNWV